VDDAPKCSPSIAGAPGANDQVMVVMNFSNKAITNYSVGGFRQWRWYVNLNSDWTTYGSTSENKGSGLVTVSAATVRSRSVATACRYFRVRRCRNWTPTATGCLTVGTGAFRQSHHRRRTADHDAMARTNLQEQAATLTHDTTRFLNFAGPDRMQNGTSHRSVRENLRTSCCRLVSVGGLFLPIVRAIAVGVRRGDGDDGTAEMRLLQPLSNPSPSASSCGSALTRKYLPRCSDRA